MPLNTLYKHLDNPLLAPDLKKVATGFVSEFASSEPDLASRLVAKGVAESFVRSAAISDYFCQNCLRRPHLVDRLLDDDHLLRRATALDEGSLVNADSVSEEQILAHFRELRHLEMMRIIWRECGGLNNVAQTLEDLSGAADALIGAAVRASHDSLVGTYGYPTGVPESDSLIVLAMGKLGGYELNMSSDVDLVFLHSQEGETDGRRSIDHHDFFVRQTRKTIDILSRLTPDGMVYRVDTRLRPFGSSGRPCVNLTAFEQYLGLHGREWERYAYIKYRPVIATPMQESELQSLIRPFVYRRYLDFGVFDGLREMKAMISAEVQRKELQTDIKRGPGGIREIEFIVQTLQLVYGGKQVAIQQAGFYRALASLTEHGYLDQATGEQLLADYNFLRRIENGLQAARDQQVHKLPQDQTDRERLALLMNKPDWRALEQQIVEVRDRVQQNFNDLSVIPEARSTPASVKKKNLLWSQLTSPDQWRDDETELSEDNALTSALRTLLGGGLRDRLDSIGQERLDRLMPQVIELLEDEHQAASMVIRILEGIGRRSAYFVLLLENPLALQRVISICQHSPQLAKQLARSPALLDTLVDPRGSSFHLTREGLKQRFDLQFGSLDPLDDERCLMALSEFKQSAVFDVAIADMEDQLPVMKISDRLTEIAELILSEAIHMATCQMQSRYGVPRWADDPDKEAEFAVVGYGKLGGLELAYSSDLDLVFLYDDGGAGQTSGERSVDNAVYFARLAQRMIHILTVPTAFGALYEVDMRLRPSGRSGLLVSRLAAFEKYQREQAWTWEHQALLRARGVGGNAELIAKFEALRCELLLEERDKTDLLNDVAGMRTKMKDNLDRSTQELFDLKHGPGGLTDLEFLVQYLVLSHCTKQPYLTTYSDNIRQIEALNTAGILRASDEQAISQTYLGYRQHLHHLALQEQDTLVDPTLFQRERELVCAALTEHGLLQKDSSRQ